MAVKSGAPHETVNLMGEAVDFIGDASGVNVPIVDSAEVARLKAQLAEAETRATTAEKTVAQTLGVHRGMAQPEIAEPYVLGSEEHAGLNETNAEDTMSLADVKNKPEFKSSHITHRLGNRKTAGRGATFWLYDKQGMARRVPGQSLNSALAFGLRPTCPKCDGYHKETMTNPNACPARSGKIERTVCTVCKNLYGKSIFIYDTQETFATAAEEQEDDDTLQVMDMPSNPRARLQIKLEDHIRWWHPATAASMKLI